MLAKWTSCVLDQIRHRLLLLCRLVLPEVQHHRIILQPGTSIKYLHANGALRPDCYHLD